MNDRITPEDIEKWLSKLEPFLGKIEVSDPKGEEMLTNMKAYISDSKHFREKGDLVRSFEAMLWAWCIFETSRNLGVFKIC